MPRRRTRTVRSAGGVVIRSVEGSRHVLLIKDSYDKWGLPKGHAEAGEALHETALREVSEETGLADLELGPELVTIDWTFRSGGEEVHKFATFFLMFSQRGDPVPELEEGISEAVWIPLESAHQHISYANATAVVRVAQAILLDVGPATPQTEPASR
ncbi:MAG TPA: NUDIX hydrolase [Vicinamibacteria bacterium]